MSVWRQRALGEICEVIAGQSPKSSAYNDAGDGLPFYQGKKDFTDRYVAPPSTWTTSITKRALPDDILMSVRAPVGPINITRHEVCIGRGLAAIRAGKEIDRGFLWYALLWLQPKIVGNAGAVFPSINKKQIEALPLLVPPKEVQKRIVAVLDEAFRALDRARANTEANMADVESLRGPAATDLLKQGCPPAHWTAHTLDDIAILRGGYAFKSSQYTKDGAFVLRTVNIDNDGSIKRGNDKFIGQETVDEYQRFELQPGDTLFVMVGATLGKIGFVEVADFVVGRGGAMLQE